MAMTEHDMEIARGIEVNADTLPELIKGYQGAIQGDMFGAQTRFWDIEFPNMFCAVSFAETIKYSDDVWSVDIRHGDRPKSIYNTVTLTVAQKVD